MNAQGPRYMTAHANDGNKQFRIAFTVIGLRVPINPMPCNGNLACRALLPRFWRGDSIPIQINSDWTLVGGPSIRHRDGSS